MKIFIAVVASLVVNGGVFGGLAYSAYQAQLPPLGEVLVVQLPNEASLPICADARQIGPSAARML
jgi:hypothetical protein